MKSKDTISWITYQIISIYIHQIHSRLVGIITRKVGIIRSREPLGDRSNTSSYRVLKEEVHFLVGDEI